MQKCEVASKYILPFIRSFIAKYLIKEMGLTQVEAAERMKITQAAISQYLKKKRAKRIMHSLDERIKEKLESVAFEIGSSDLSEEELQKMICDLCSSIYGMIK